MPKWGKKNIPLLKRKIEDPYESSIFFFIVSFNSSYNWLSLFENVSP